MLFDSFQDWIDEITASGEALHQPVLQYEITQKNKKEEDDRVTYFLKGNVIAAVRAGISSAKSSLNITVRAEGENIKISRRISEVITNALEELIKKNEKTGIISSVIFLVYPILWAKDYYSSHF